MLEQLKTVVLIRKAIKLSGDPKLLNGSVNKHITVNIVTFLFCPPGWELSPDRLIGWPINIS